MGRRRAHGDVFCAVVLRSGQADHTTVVRFSGERAVRSSALGAAYRCWRTDGDRYPVQFGGDGVPQCAWALRGCTVLRMLRLLSTPAMKTTTTATIDWRATLTEALNAPGSLGNTYTRFYNYSFLNQIRLMMQGTREPVATYNRWIELGRQVRKGSKAKVVLAPVLVGGRPERPKRQRRRRRRRQPAQTSNPGRIP